MEDENVANFVGLTGSTPERAQQYLKLSDNSIEQAIELFFSTGGIDLAGPASSAPTQPSSAPPVPHSTRPSGQPGQVIDLDSDNEVSDDDTPQITGVGIRQPPAARSSGHHTPGTSTPQTAQSNFIGDDDEAMARRLQEEIYAGGDMNGGVDADGYRAPIARTRETLVGPGSYDLNDPTDLQAAVLEQLRAREPRRNPARSHAAGIFNQRPVASSIWNESTEGSSSQDRRAALNRATAGASENSAKANLLAEMYRPPFEIMSRLPWEAARTQGKDEEKWILVDVQDPSIFDCQLLNRDIWKNEGIKDTVRENFIFMQYSKDDPKGREYIQYYFQGHENTELYPHIAIVDPRTGEQVKVWSGRPAPKAMEFLMQLHEFLDRYSLNASAKNPIAKRKPEPRKEMAVERMTEDEMLEMALQNSLAGAPADLKDVDPDELTRSLSDVRKGKEVVEDEDDAEMTDVEGPSTNGHDTPSASTASPFASISSSNPHVEPPPDGASTRIQFRHSNGRVVRRFLLTDLVRRLYEWLKASPMEGKGGAEFELIFMQKNLIESLDQTVERAGLKNGTVMVEFIEAS